MGDRPIFESVLGLKINNLYHLCSIFFGYFFVVKKAKKTSINLSHIRLRTASCGSKDPTMKTKAFIFTILTLLVMSFQCEDQRPIEEVLDGCIDPSLIRDDVACLMIYLPVCGCDGKTYGNACAAGSSGVKSFVQGECPK